MALWPTPQAKQGGGSMPPSNLYICGKLKFSVQASQLSACYKHFFAIMSLWTT